MRQVQKVQATVGARLFEVNISVNDKCNRPCLANVPGVASLLDKGSRLG